MDGSPGISILFILILIIFNGFFSATEMAIVSLNKTKLNLLTESGNKKALMLTNLLNESSNFLATIQIGITLGGFLASGFSAISLSARLAQLLLSFEIPYSIEISFLVTTIFTSYITLIFGELIPKQIGLRYSEKIAMNSVFLIVVISKMAKPFVWILSLSTNIFLKIIGLNQKNIVEDISREEIKNIIHLGEEHGAINEVEADMIDSIIKFDDTLVKEVMTPRTKTFILEVNDSIEENIDKILEENYSRIPIYEKSIDNIVGILHLKDLFSHIIKNGISNIYIKDIMREPCFVPETNTIQEVFMKLKESKNYLGVLIDEYGGFSGIATFEDLVEEVVGEILDEYDDELSGIEKLDQNNYIVDGLLSISDVNQHLNINLEANSCDTIGGLFLESLGSLPKKNDNVEIEIGSILLKLINVEDNRIKKIKISIIQ